MIHISFLSSVSSLTIATSICFDDSSEIVDIFAQRLYPLLRLGI